MNSGLEDQLRTAFEQASDFIQPGPELASRVRATARRRRAMVATVAVACALILIATGVSYLATGLRRDASVTRHHQGPTGRIARTLVRADFPIEQLAVSGRYLYVDSSSNDTLSAYDRVSGKLLRMLTVADTPSALAVGPSGLVWLAFYANQSGGPTGIWLLSPDLRQRSAEPGIGADIIVPSSRTTAWVPTQDGLVRVGMPTPGQPGRATAHLDPSTSLGPSLNTAPGHSAALLDGRVAVQVSNSGGFHSHVVIAGHPGVTFGGSPDRNVGSFTSTGNALWAATFRLLNGKYESAAGPLVQLDSRLRPTTPQSVRTSPVLTKTEQVWSAGETVWVSTAVPGHRLACFRAGGRVGPVTTLPVHGQVVALAATSGTVYFSTGSVLGTVGPSTVSSLPVPGVCR